MFKLESSAISENYSKDPHLAGIFWDSLIRRNIHDFRNALEESNCDPNLVDASSGLSVFQTVLETPNSVEFIKLCADHGADLYTKSASGRYPIHFAVKSLCVKNLEIFFKNYDTSRVNVKYNGLNCLHLCIRELNNTNKADVIECIKLLLAKDCSPNMADFQSKTPFYYLLVEKEHPQFDDLLDYMLSSCELDFHTYKGPEMLKMMKAIRPAHQILSSAKAINFEFMMTALNRREELEFEIYFKAFQSATEDKEKFTDNCSSFLEVAAAGGMRFIVEFLLEKRVDINARPKCPKYMKPPAFLACTSGYFRVLEMLLRKQEVQFFYQRGLEKHSLLHEICQNFTTHSKETVNVDYQKCFDMIVKDRRCDLNAEDDLGCSPLHYTVMKKNDYATIALLKRGAYINEESDFGKTPIDEISLDIMENFLNECISKRERKDGDKKTDDIVIDYNFLIAPNRNRDVDSADKDGFCKEIATLQRIAQNDELKNLVSHPVLSSFVFLKWTRLSFLFYVNLALCSIFMIALVSFIVLSEVKGHEKSLIFHVLRWVSFLSISLLMLREFVQLLLSYKTYYKSFTNWFEIALILLAWTFFIESYTKNDKCPKDKEDCRDTERVIKAFLILGASFEFLQIIGSLPFLSVSTHMVILKRVSITFLKSIFLYSILIFAFGLSFFVMFSEPIDEPESNSTDAKSSMKSGFETFSTPQISIVRSLVMLTGEFDASDMKLDNQGCIIFVLFLFLVTIVLFNLLNALAVSDTQAIKAKGEIIDLIQRIEVLNGYESVIFKSQLSLKFNIFQRIFPWLRSIISLFPHVIPKGRIMINTSNNDETIAMRAHKSMSRFNLIRNFSINKCENSIENRLPRMSTTIMKRIKNILAEKEEKKLKEMIDNKLKEDIKTIKTQMNFQLKRNNELLNEQKIQINHQKELLVETKAQMDLQMKAISEILDLLSKSQSSEC